MKAFQKMLGLMASASFCACFECGPFSTGLNHESRTHACQGELGLHSSSGCKDSPWMDDTPGNDLQKEGGPDRRFQHRLASAVRCKPAFGHWSKEESQFHINFLEMLVVCLGLRSFLPDLRRHHMLVCSDSMTVVS